MVADEDFETELNEEKPKKEKRYYKWDDRFYVKVYQLVKDGCRGSDGLAQALGVDRNTWKRWIKEKPALHDAIAKASSVDEGAVTLMDFVYKRLPPKLQRYWDELEGCEDSARGFRARRVLMAGWAVRVKKHLFAYALTVCNFSASRACEITTISHTTYNEWIKTDPKFVELIHEIHTHKKNFFENALVEAVNRGETSAILFANRTINRDRGYTDKQVVAHEHSGTIEHKHTTDITAVLMGLPIETRQVVLAAIRAAQNPPPGLPAPRDTIDGEFTTDKDGRVDSFRPADEDDEPLGRDEWAA